VLVAAPTGAGKTVVGWFGIDQARRAGRRAFYTTPIKALSNQKFRELSGRYGISQVGLLTGDQSIRPAAPVVVMTTEVLRNMLYTDAAALSDLGLVVLDEVHYLADRFRGPVWEEILIQLPQTVQVAALSATVSNAEEFGEWMELVRGAVKVVVSDVRPVPLWQHVLTSEGLKDLYAPFVRGTPSTPGTTGAGGTTGSQSTPGATGTYSSIGTSGTPGGSDGEPVSLNPELSLMAHSQGGFSQAGHRGRSPVGRKGRVGRSSQQAPQHHSASQHHSADYPAPATSATQTHGAHPRRTLPRFAVVEALEREALLPAIYFVFSRAGCEAAAEQCRTAGLVLTSPKEANQIEAVLEQRAGLLSGADLAVVGYSSLLEGARAGFAPHHAGMLPLFKEAVEELFQDGLLKVVFATETLALGINMPARTVVIDRLDKWDGAEHAEITPGQYTQLTGRAGRRGIDIEGHAVVVAGPRVSPAKVLPLASKRTYPLRSSFHPTYNMTVNLTERLGADRAHQVLRLSFAQFQADRSVVGLAGQIRQLDEAIIGYRQALTCDAGDAISFLSLRERISRAERDLARTRSQHRRATNRAVISRLRRGDILRLGKSSQASLLLVIHAGKAGSARPLVITAQGKARRQVIAENGPPVELVGHIKLRAGLAAKTAEQRSALAATMSRAVAAQVDDAVPPFPQPASAPSANPVPQPISAQVSGSTEPFTSQNQEHLADQPPNGPTPAELRREIEDLRRQLAAHPVAGCPDRATHVRWARRLAKAEDERDRLERTMAHRTGSLSRQFDRISGVLEDLGYLHQGQVTPDGRRLARIYAESDLVIAECIGQGVWAGLSAPALAAAVTALVYEPRTEAAATEDPPHGIVRQTIATQGKIWGRVAEREEAHGVPFSPRERPDASAAVLRWGSGAPLSEALAGGPLSPGDFVRLVSRVIDVLEHIRSVAPNSQLYHNSGLAISHLRRGVVVFDQA
jgi:ATP-dependent RNA helicase HelY